ncbi:MAG: nucleotidyltransferase [Velocimicrobium sp.]
MSIVGVIVEYNPFHNGHKYHLEQAKTLSGADYVVAIMSGNFVQRGIPAITDKYTRTAMALQNGADIVYELPAFYATSSAESFAYGAVSILNGLGVIDYLCFGAEDNDLSLMQEIAKLLNQEPSSYTSHIKRELSNGIPFPVARKNALIPLLSGKNSLYIEHFLESSNNILGIEYLKALALLQSNITPLIVKRQGSIYNEEGLPSPSTFPSATALRKSYCLNASLKPYAPFVPKSAFDLLNDAKNKSFPLELDDFSEYLYYKLSYITYEDLITYVDISPDLAMRILKLRRDFTNISEFANKIKTRQFTLTRIQRVLLHILLNVRIGMAPSPYAHLLGFKKASTSIINKKRASIPIITKSADSKKLLEHDIFCTDLYNRVVAKKFQYCIASDFTHPLIIQ